ncbi:hypothetical protein SCHPADRAFT_192352 [Schizopora paradoxa]|uniref:Uncharacterized protein n=1 Tax=Schizopora paradoxa TaxID=27342 RepID=A0A0H2RZ31_9AGAM|nr:hypothetical protein SCHPADRAFT_192352 [Schizopora paradoxa]
MGCSSLGPSYSAESDRRSGILETGIPRCYVYVMAIVVIVVGEGEQFDATRRVPLPKISYWRVSYPTLVTRTTTTFDESLLNLSPQLKRLQRYLKAMSHLSHLLQGLTP